MSTPFHNSKYLKNVEENRSLKELCTFGIGGPAKYYVTVHSVAALSEAIVCCRLASVPYFILGKGSNSLFDDRGFNGAVIANKIEGIADEGAGVFSVGSGTSFALFGIRAARQGWSGLEFAAGIPGSVGGAVFMNAGANGSETCEHLCSVEYVSETGELQSFSRTELSFGYRSSSFQHWAGAIASVRFALTADILARKRQIEIVRGRHHTQPYSDKSAGCIFRNTEHSSAGALIDKAGLKGLRIGDALVSLRHANFIVNVAEAKASDVLALIEAVQCTVKDRCGVSLCCEVRYIKYEE